MERRLAAIMAADVVGYSRLIRADEEGTIAALKALRADLIDPKIAEHNGRIVKLMGDGMLAEFASVVDAVRAAVETQRAVAEHNAGLPEEKRIEFRVGINLGDVVIDGDDIHGDGVNVAARLEAMAEPGGVCVSGMVYEGVRDRIDFPFEDMGEQEVKNIDRPVRVYRVRLEAQAAGTVIGERSVIGGRSKWAAAAAAALMIVVAGVVLWLRPWAPSGPVVLEAEMAFPLPDKPSIAVLPFTNMSGDQAQDPFVDGLTDDIITDLSGISGLFVIAANTAFTYKGKAVNVQQVARELGVRYVLEGSARKANGMVRINAQLVEATTGTHLWAERYDRNLRNVFAVQDEIAHKIVSILAVKLTASEEKRLEAGSRYTRSPEAYLKRVAAYQLIDTWTKEGNARALTLCGEAIQIDPEFAFAYSCVGWVHLFDAMYGWSESPRESLELAHRFAQKAITTDPTVGEPYTLLATVHAMRREHNKALATAEKAIAVEPNYPDNYACVADVYNFLGQPELAVEMVHKALRLNPNPPNWYLTSLGRAYFALGRYEDAVQWLSRFDLDVIGSRTFLIASYGQLGREEEARTLLAAHLAANPDFSIASVSFPYKDSTDMEHLRDGLRKAGLPE